MIGLSTSGSISFGCALVAGRNRVPSPAAGKTALRTLIFIALSYPSTRPATGPWQVPGPCFFLHFVSYRIARQTTHPMKSGHAFMDVLDLRSELERLHVASFGWALWCCGRRRDEAEEVLQSAYLKILEGRARFDGNSGFGTWAFGAIGNTAAEHRRQAWLRKAFSMRWLAERTSREEQTDVELLAADSESNRRLRLALAQLPSRQKDVLHL